MSPQSTILEKGNATLNSNADGVLVVRDGKVSGWNQRFFEMWHLLCVPVIGMQDTELLSTVLDQLQNPDQFAKKVNKLYSNPSATSFDVLRHTLRGGC